MYPLLIASILCASMNSILLHRVRLSSAAAVYRLNLIASLVWLVCLFSLNGFRLSLSRAVILFALIYGITQAAFILFKSLAMNRGPVSVTALFGNGSLLLSVAVCYFAFDEAVTIWDVIGLIALLAAIVMTTYKRGDGRGEAPKRGWLTCAFLFLILGAGVGISFKAFGKSGAGDSAGDMMCIAAAIMALLYLPLYLTARKKEGGKGADPDRRFIPIAIASGLLACCYNRLNITLSGALDAIIFFPFFNGGVIILTTVCSVIFTKEGLRPTQVAGILLGTAAIAVIGIF